MSEPVLTRLLEAADPDELRERWRAVRESGEVAGLVEELLKELCDERRRERALAVLRPLRKTDPLLEALAGGLRDQRRPHRRNAARTALAELASPGATAPEAALERLALLLDDEDSDVRLMAATALGESGNREAVPLLADALEDPEVNVVAAVADALGEIGDPDATAPLVRAVQTGEFWVRLAAVTALGRLGDEAAIPVLGACLSERLLRGPAAEALAEIGGEGALTALGLPSEEEAEASRLRAGARILAARPELAPPEWLRRGAAEQERDLVERVREEGDEDAARLLGIAATPRAVDALLDLARHEDSAAAALAALDLAPAEAVAGPLLQRLAGAAPGERAALLGGLLRVRTVEETESVLPHLGDPDPEVRGAAAELLGRSRPELVLDALGRALGEPGLRLGAVEALARVGPAACGVLVTCLGDAASEVRAAAAGGLARCGNGDARDTITRALQRESEPHVRRALLGALGRSGGAAAVPVLAAFLSHDDVATRFAAARALGCTQARDALRPLLEALVDPASEVRAAALRSLGELADPRGAEPVSGLLHSRDRDLRRAAADALRRMGAAAAGERLLEALDDVDWQVRIAAVRGLRRLGGPELAERLATVAAADPDPMVRRAASAPADGAAEGAGA